MSVVLPHKPLKLITDTKRLRMKSARVPATLVPGLVPMIQQMYRICFEENGAAIAAPQVGIPLRFFLAMSREEDDLDFDVLFNPTYKPLKAHGQEEGIEGCLSYPDDRFVVKRWRRIHLSWQLYNDETKTFRRMTKKVDGFLARIAQHEIDHLDGKLIPEIGRPADGEFVAIEPGEHNGVIET